MALKGTIKDFALPDIFQLIGIQKKTGILTLADGEEAVMLKFFEGQVVGADTESMSLEHRLGQVLVRTDRITQAQLDEALRTQKHTLQRLGYILVNSGCLPEQALVEALRIQSCQIIYRLFRWREGDYHFEALDDLEYDERYFTPIGAETILMEGARMIDEWPIIERRIKNESMVFRKTAAAEALARNEPEPAPRHDIEFDFGFDLDREPEPEPPPKEDAARAGIELTEDECHLLERIDGKRTVGEICDMVALGDFDTYRTLADLLVRNLIEEVPRSRIGKEQVQTRSQTLHRLGVGLGNGLVLLAAVASLLTLGANPITPWRVLAAQPATAQLRRHVTVTRLEKVETALEVFYLDSGTVPGELGVLAHNGYLAPEDLRDSWGRDYAFRLSPGGWRLAVLDEAGQPDELAVTRNFNAARQLMLSDTTEVPRPQLTEAAAFCRWNGLDSPPSRILQTRPT